MSKLFQSSDYVEEMAEDAFNNASLNGLVRLNVISTSKAKELIKVSKVTPETEFLINKEGVVTLTVFEKAFERLDEDSQKKIMEGAVSCINYDSEKDKISIDKSELNMVNRMRHKYTNDILDIFEGGVMAIQQVEEEEKEEKAMQKEAKKQKS